jgi:hypothetical protein
MMIKFLGFSFKKGLLYLISYKNSHNLVTFIDVHILLIYIKVFWNILGVYLYIQEFNYIFKSIFNIHFAYIVAM